MSTQPESTREQRIPWANAGGPDECEHGYAYQGKIGPCPTCFPEQPATQPVALEGRWIGHWTGYFQGIKYVRQDDADQKIDALEAERDALRRKAAGWLIARCNNCGLSIGQPEPELWIHLYGPEIGNPFCNRKHGTQSERATPDRQYYERVEAILKRK